MANTIGGIPLWLIGTVAGIIVMVWWVFSSMAHIPDWDNLYKCKYEMIQK